MKTALQLLRYAIDDLYVASCNRELDRKSHGPNVQKNSATFANYMKYTMLGYDVLHLVRRARAEVVANPSPRGQRALAKCERQIRIWIERFDGAFPQNIEILDGWIGYYTALCPVRYSPSTGVIRIATEISNEEALAIVNRLQTEALFRGEYRRTLDLIDHLREEREQVLQSNSTTTTAVH